MINKRCTCGDAGLLRPAVVAVFKPDDRPNLVYGADVHVVWDKFCRYFDVEPRQVPIPRGRCVIGPEELEPGGFVTFAEKVIPELQRRGIFRTEYEGRTLRENLGLYRPANPFSRRIQETAVAG